MGFKRIIGVLAFVLISSVNFNVAIAQEGPSGLKITDVVKGEGDEALLHSMVLVHYTGWLMDGTKFDSSLDRGQPFPFTIGIGKVIAGWDVGVGGMKVGGKRELIIPPEMAYGERGASGSIPPNSTLKFEVELIAVQPPAYKTTKLDEIAALVGQGAKVIDIRSQAQAKETGVIEGARVMTAFDENFRFQQSFVAAFQAYVTPDEMVVLIGPAGRGVLSLAHVVSTQGGYKNIYAAKEGMAGWVKAEMMTVAPFE